ncbi:MAG: EAL domain-containing protein, partial [Clostridia bacterium]|nr:EAL domain-containing protein [Clostridia bacterium]
DRGVRERTLIEQHLHQALQNEEFELYYQPQLIVETGMISGFEALIRWKNPTLGFIPPDRFIGIAEETQLIIPIGEWVLKTACEFIKRLHSAGYEDLTMSVNVSIVQLLQEGFVAMVLQTLELTGVEPRLLELEITETILIESYETIGQKLKILKDHGVRIAMDDFGRGYSSLSGLNHLPIHTLKIDKVFMDSIQEENDDQTIADLIILIGRKMGLTVLAEGVETKAQLEYLLRHHCLMAQGYYFSKPLPEYETLQFIRNFVEQKAV